MNDVLHWLERAKELRATAVRLDDAPPKHAVLETAAAYERMAERAKERSAPANDDPSG